MDHFYTQTWDFREHVRAHREISRLTLGKWRVGVLIVGVVVLLSLLLPAVAGGQPATALLSAAPWLLLLTIWLTLFFFGLGWMTAWQTQRNDPSVRDPMHRRISADGIKIITSNSSIELKWHGIPRIVETEEFFLFFFNKQCAYYLSKRSVGDPAELSELRATIRERFRGPATLLPDAFYEPGFVKSPDH